MKKRFTKIASLTVCFLLVLGIIAVPQGTKAATSLRADSIYEIMVDRFYDGDPANNATGDAFRYAESSQDDFRYMHGGDWQGVIDKIPYIKGMGYTAVWISPIRAESTLQPGTVLVNVMDPSDRIAVSTDKKVTVSLNGNSSKIYAFGDPDKIPVTFHVTNANTNHGQNVYIVGNISELGSWAPAVSAGAAACPNYPNWQLTIELPANQSFQFKAIKKDGGGNVIWQDGGNHTYTVPSSGQGNVSINW